MIGKSGEGADDIHVVQIGEYEIIGELGSGGQGVVLRARKLSTRAEVALKIIRSDRLSPRAVNDFEREWKTVLQLKHPSIARVSDCGWYRRGECAAPYYVMELAQRRNGGRALNLLEYCTDNRLSDEQKIELMVQVCGALHAAHEKGIYHRDLKPGNIPVDEMDKGTDSGLGVPKVIDFGLAVVVSAAVVDPDSATRLGEVAGTRRYMAPEQVRGETADIGPWTDVHALGLIAFELLTGRLPYVLDGLPVDEINSRISNARRATLTELVPTADRKLSAILARATHPDFRHPGGRIQSARELQQELEAWLKNRQMRRRMTSAVRERAGSSRLALLLLASLLATAAARLAVSGWAMDALGLNAAYERWLCHLDSPIVNQPMDDVAVVALDETFNDPAALTSAAAKLGLNSVSMNETGGMRPLYAAAARLIADKGGARVVAIDSYWEGESRFNDEAIKQLSLATTPGGGGSIILGMPEPSYERDQQTQRDIPTGMSPPLALAAPCWGGLTGVYEDDQYWSVDLLVQRGENAPIPSLPVMAYTRFKDGSASPTFSLGEGERTARAILPSGPKSATGRQIDLPPMPLERLTVNRAEQRLGLEPGDLVNKFLIAPPTDAALKNATVALTDVVNAAADGNPGASRLWGWFHGKAVIIGDTRQTRNDGLATDIKDHASGRQLAGVYTQAIAIQWLIDGRAVRFPGSLADWGSTWLLAALGVGVAYFGSRRPTRRWRRARVLLILCAIALGCIVTVTALYYGGLWMVYPWTPLAAMVIGAVLGKAAVCFAGSRAEAGEFR